VVIQVLPHLDEVILGRFRVGALGLAEHRISLEGIVGRNIRPENDARAIPAQRLDVHDASHPRFSHEVRKQRVAESPPVRHDHSSRRVHEIDLPLIRDELPTSGSDDLGLWV
jgi:hypothetical protein